MTNEEYFARPEISREDLLLFRHSPNLFHTAKTGGIAAEELKQVMELLDPASAKVDAFAVGEAVHRLVLEPHTVEDRFVVIDPAYLTTNGQRRGNKWDEYKAKHDAQGKLLVTQAQMSLIHMVARSARKVLGPMLVDSAIYEQPLIWTEETDDGLTVDCKGKPDFMLCVKEKSFGLILDLKTCRFLNSFRYSVKDYAYWMQAVHYQAGFETMFGFVPDFYFVAVEKTPPFRCELKELSPSTLDRASVLRKELLANIARRRETGNWEDPEPTEIEQIHVDIN